MADTPLLDWRPQTERLFKKAGTSSEAAAGASLTSAERRRLILELLSTRPCTPDEVAEHYGWVVNTARARISEMVKRFDENGNRLPPLLTETGERRRASGGRPANVMRITTEEERRNWRA